MLCCEIPQLVCTHQRNVTGRSNVIKKNSNLRESLIVLYQLQSLFLFFPCLNSIFFFPFPNPPQVLPCFLRQPLPFYLFSPLYFSVRVSDMPLPLWPSLLSKHRQRERSEHISCTWGHTDLRPARAALASKLLLGPVVWLGECSLQQEPWGA